MGRNKQEARTYLDDHRGEVPHSTVNNGITKDVEINQEVTVHERWVNPQAWQPQDLGVAQMHNRGELFSHPRVEFLVSKYVKGIYIHKGKQFKDLELWDSYQRRKLRKGRQTKFLRQRGYLLEQLGHLLLHLQKAHHKLDAIRGDPHDHWEQAL